MGVVLGSHEVLRTTKPIPEDYLLLDFLNSLYYVFKNILI